MDDDSGILGGLVAVVITGLLVLGVAFMLLKKPAELDPLPPAPPCRDSMGMLPDDAKAAYDALLRL